MRFFFRSRQFKIIAGVLAALIVTSAVLIAVGGMISPQSGIVGSLLEPFERIGSSAGAYIRDFSAATSEEKTACLLLNEADEDGVAVLKNVTAILKTMNLSRASFYRSLASFCTRGLIEKNGNQIQIINSKELKGILS